MLTKIEAIKYLCALVDYTPEGGELLKAYGLVECAPASIKEEEDVLELKSRIKSRLDHIAGFQRSVRTDSGFVDPPDVTKIPAYVRLREVLNENPEIYKILDIGCFSGWLGRNLSLWGYKVHGIDLSPQTLEVARYMATGTSATFEVLEGTKAGQKYPGEFDAVVMFDVLEHVFDQYLLLQSAEMAIRDGGMIFINLPKVFVPTKPSPDSNKEHMRAFTFRDVEDIFSKKKGFNVTDLGESLFIYYYK